MAARQRRAWQLEYARSGRDRIESSYSVRPERCVAWFLSQWAGSGRRPGRVLDLGCGRGRNSLPFLRAGWRVTGLDAVPAALRDFAGLAGGVRRRLRLVRGDLGRRLPFAAGSFDAVLEITAADNLLTARDQARFWRETARVLKPGGRLLTYHFNRADGYYGALLRRSPLRAAGRLHDERAGMDFRFYRTADILSSARGAYRRVRSRHYRYPGPMFGRRWVRDLTAAVLERTAG
jgi:SAM-dependent methyltransferase